VADAAAPQVSQLTFTLDVIRTRGVLTLRASLRDQTAVPLEEHAVSLVTAVHHPAAVAKHLRKLLDPLHDRCLLEGTSAMEPEKQPDLRGWTEHVVLDLILRSLLDGLATPPTPAQPAGGRYGERPVVVVADRDLRQGAPA
jgi:hypothetical protein